MLVKTKTYSKYLIGHLDKVTRPLISILPKEKEEVKEKSNKLISFQIDDEKLLGKCKAIWTKIEDFKNIEWNALPVFCDRYKKTKIRTNGDKVYTDFRGVNVPENDIECKYFLAISIDFLLVYENKYYLQVYLDNCTYKTANKQMTDYLDYYLFETD